MTAYLIAVGNAFSQFLNTALLFGDEDESVSGRAFRRDMEGSAVWYVVRRVINGLFFWQADHCKASYGNDLWLCHQRINAHYRFFKDFKEAE